MQMTENPNLAGMPKGERSPRLSVTVPSETYHSLEIIAKKKKVSLAWVVRDAAERYVSDELPLFRETRNA
ncbi:MAG: ribbon-helix-helix domain-containing protein [Terriglobia bacterium]|nr:ribbon-helix-helix domain-containing protein [Terriglobia bacterium]